LGHFRDVGALAKHPSGDESMFLSVSLDGSVKIWSLDVRLTSLLYDDL